MATPYELEHNIETEIKRPTRRPSMSSFFAQLNNIETTNDRALPTPVEVAGAERLLLDQLVTLHSTAPESNNAIFLESLISEVEDRVESPPEKVEGVPQSYLDELERVPKKELKKGDTCPICAEPFLDDPYPLVVELPCHKSHRFDLECVGPWLRMVGTCPLDRKELLKKKEAPKEVNDDEEEEDEIGGMYG